MGKIFRMVSLAFCVFLSNIYGLMGQSVNPFETVKTRLEKDPFKIGGFIGTQMTANALSGLERRLDPFRFRLNTQLSVTSYGFNTSISFNYANGNRIYRFTRPDVSLPSYAFVGVSPSYKWATLHLGTRNLNFSKYTLSGHSFVGAGLELKPGNWSISSMYGRLRRATAEDFKSLQSLDASYRRMGWGIKVGYQQNGEELAVILFNAFEDGTSIRRENLPDFLTPAENSIISLLGKKKIGNIITLDINYAMSAYSPNRNAETIKDLTGISILDRIGGLFTPRFTSSYQKALHTQLSFATAFGKIRVGHERVDPEYRTMGALFFFNDYENITGGIDMGVANNKLLLSSDLGFQRNNISNKESNQANRFIGSVNAILQYSDKTSVSTTFSNFQTTNKLRTSTLPFVAVDSIVLSLVNQNFQVSYNRLMGKNNTRSFNATISYQRSQGIENDEVKEEQSNSNLMANLIYQHSFPKNGLNISGNLLFNRNLGFYNNVLTIAPNLGVGKKWLENKLTTQGSIALINLYLDNQASSRILQSRITTTYQFTKKQSLRFSANFLWSNDQLADLRDFQEVTSTLDWRMRF